MNHELKITTTTTKSQTLKMGEFCVTVFETSSKVENSKVEDDNVFWWWWWW